MIKYVTLGNKDALQVTFCTLGASIYAIRFNNRLMTLTPKRKRDFALSYIYHGKTIGPVCGRIKKGKLFIKDKEYDFLPNEGENTLHGGPSGFSNQIFAYELINNGIVFAYEDDLGKYIVEYRIDDSTLKVNYRIELKKEIPIAITNHSYFTLGSKNILKTKLQISASKFIEVNSKDLIPERIRKVLPCLNFKKPRNIGRCINNSYLKDSKTNGYDHSLILDEVGSPIILENKKYRLTITSNFNAVQIYSDNYNENVEMLNTKEKVYRGIAIEPQDNQLERKSYRDTYSRFIEYRFSKND